MKLNLYENFTNCNVLQNIEIEDWFELIRSSEYSEIINRARKGEQDYDKTKQEMPCVTYNFLFNNYKANKNIIGSTGLMYIDIDNPSFDIDTLDKSKVFAYYRSFGGDGYAIIVKVDNLLAENFKSTYVCVCSILGVTSYVDTNAIKPTQFNALSFDENIFINNDSHVFQSELDNVTVAPSIVYQEERKAYTVDGATLLRSQIRFNNLDEIVIHENYIVNWQGYEYVNCWIPMNKRPKQQRNNFLLSYANNFVWLNPTCSYEKVVDVLMNVNEVALVEPYCIEKIRGIASTMFRYRAEGTLRPIYNKNTRKIVFNKNCSWNKEQKLDAVRTELAIMRTDKSIGKLIDIINNWDYSNGNISVRSIVKHNEISFKTVKKYYPQFKDQIAQMNSEWKKNKQVLTKIDGI